VERSTQGLGSHLFAQRLVLHEHLLKLVLVIQKGFCNLADELGLGALGGKQGRTKVGHPFRLLQIFDLAGGHQPLSVRRLGRDDFLGMGFVYPEDTDLMSGFELVDQRDGGDDRIHLAIFQRIHAGADAKDRGFDVLDRQVISPEGRQAVLVKTTRLAQIDALALKIADGLNIAVG